MPKTHDGRYLCTHCRDGYHTQRCGAGVIQRCFQGECECLCEELAHENITKVKRDKSLQTKIDTSPNDLTIGPRS